MNIFLYVNKSMILINLLRIQPIQRKGRLLPPIEKLVTELELQLYIHNLENIIEKLVTELKVQLYTHNLENIIEKLVTELKFQLYIHNIENIREASNRTRSVYIHNLENIREASNRPRGVYIHNLENIREQDKRFSYTSTTYKYYREASNSTRVVVMHPQPRKYCRHFMIIDTRLFMTL